MTKQLIVNTAVQAALLNVVLIDEMANGFWKDGRPKGANEAWAGVTATTGAKFGALGFTIPRTYNYLNPEFLKARGADMLAAAQTIDPSMTMKRLYRELTELSRIVGGRVTEANGQIVKLNRGQKPPVAKKSTNKVTTRKVAATIAEPQPEEVPA
jgi:hypothetical protein